MPRKSTSKSNTITGNVKKPHKLSLLVFLLTIATGLMLIFGAIQQVGFLSWEQSLKQTEASLAAEKELVRITSQLKDKLIQYKTNKLALSEEEIIETAKRRFNNIKNALPHNPNVVSEIMTDWSLYEIPEKGKTYFEVYEIDTFRIVEFISRRDPWNLYVVNTRSGDTYDLYTKLDLERNRNATQSLYTLENIAFIIP